MKTKAISSIFVLFAIAAGIASMAPAAFADHPEVAITTVEESGFSQGCVESGCYTPVSAKVSVGSVVTMTNTDTTGVHTFTSGTVDGFTPSPDGIFDSGVLMNGDSFTWKANVSGKVPYYCMLHTWMTGTIIVGEAKADELKADEKRLAEEKRLADAKKAEEKRLADAKKAEEKALADKKNINEKSLLISWVNAKEIRYIVKPNSTTKGKKKIILNEFLLL